MLESYKMRQIIIAILIGLFSIIANAELTQSTQAGFITEHSTVVSHDIKNVFSTMTHYVGSWWSSDHSFSGVAKNMQIDNNCFCERWDNNLVRHLDTVIWLENEQVVFEGGLGPLKSLGISGTMIWSLSVAEHNSTKIHWKYYVHGFSDTDMSALATAVDSVLAEQQKALTDHLK